MKCREKLRRWGSPLTCLCLPQNQMVSTLFILTLSYSSLPCSIYRLFIVANKIKWNPCYQQGRLGRLPWSPAPAALGALLPPGSGGPRVRSLKEITLSLLPQT